ncbi:MAG: hypothetical protein ABR884_01735 [Minisyncoccia bacterium]
MKKKKITYEEARKVLIERNPYLCGILDEINKKLDILIKKQREWIEAFDKRQR